MIEPVRREAAALPHLHAHSLRAAGKVCNSSGVRRSAVPLDGVSLMHCLAPLGALVVQTGTGLRAQLCAAPHLTVGMADLLLASPHKQFVKV